MEKMKMESIDIIAQNVENIGNLFPDCITEARDENGKIQKVVDRDRLMQKFSHKIIGGCNGTLWIYLGRKKCFKSGSKYDYK